MSIGETGQERLRLYYRLLRWSMSCGVVHMVISVMWLKS